MAHSLETRVPFLDNDLVDFIQKIPVRYKLGNLQKVLNMNENDIGKGFSSPDESWFRGESIEFVKSKLFSKNSKIYDYLDKTVTKKLVNEHLSGKKNRRLLIWSLLNLDSWLNQNL